jgi:hypothetical protein
MMSRDQYLPIGCCSAFSAAARIAPLASRCTGPGGGVGLFPPTSVIATVTAAPAATATPPSPHRARGSGRRRDLFSSAFARATSWAAGGASSG